MSKKNQTYIFNCQLKKKALLKVGSWKWKTITGLKISIETMSRNWRPQENNKLINQITSRNSLKIQVFPHLADSKHIKPTHICTYPILIPFCYNRESVLSLQVNTSTKALESMLQRNLICLYMQCLLRNLILLSSILYSTSPSQLEYNF